MKVSRNLVVVGGPSRNIGKTSLACSLIGATAERGWTAVKISQFGHGVCTTSGRECGCAVDDPKHPFAISAEDDPAGDSDTARMLRAGALKVFWLRAPQGRLAEAMPLLEQALEGAENALIESNTVVDFLPPTVYVQLWNAAVADVKPSARRLLDRADALATVGAGPGAGKPRFEVEPPSYCSSELVEFVLNRLQR